jgi:hypothetical protein
LDDNAIRKMRLIHGRAKMLEIAAQEMARFRRARCDEDGLVFVTVSFSRSCSSSRSS